jgi:hypothetical protein
VPARVGQARADTGHTSRKEAPTEVAALVERHHYVHAQRALLDLEMVIGPINAGTYRARITELDAAHGPSSHAARSQPQPGDPPDGRRPAGHHPRRAPNVRRTTHDLAGGVHPMRHAVFQRPDTVPSVWINTQTGCPLRPDTTPITPGEPNTAREPLCEACAPIIRASVGKPQPLHELFPQAHIHRRQAPD